jgi:hypothetical protein
MEARVLMRAHIPMIEKAAALGAVVLGLPYDHRVLMSAEQVMSLLHFDHDPIPHAEDGPGLHFNLTPLPIMAHRIKTATIDLPGIAKRKRVAAKHGQHQAKIEAKLTGDVPSEPRRRSRKLQSRGFQKIHRPMRSRNTLRRSR